MNPVVIGFDTSCYTTSVAAATPDGHLVCSCRKLLPVQTGERGLRQSDAVFLHIKQIPDLVREVFARTGDLTVCGVCASTRPRASDESYMPVFTVGKTVAESIAASAHVPLYETDHQHGHFAAAAYESGISAERPFLALHLSGGTTDLVLVRDKGIDLLGTSLDLHAGQLIDRIGVALGLPFPAGPELEKLASAGQAKALIPSSLAEDGISCHLSGAEAACIRLLHEGKTSGSDLAAEVFDCLARTVAKMTVKAVTGTGCKNVLLAGGVSSSVLFRDMVQSRIRKMNHEINLYFGHPEFSGDNAAGVALIGAAYYRDRSENL